MAREKMYVEYPVAESLEQAITWLEAGNEVWQEDSNDWPSCGGFDKVEDLKYDFPDGIDETYNVHLVPKVPEKAEPFKVDDGVVALKDVDDIEALSGLNVSDHTMKDGKQYLFFYDHDGQGPWDAGNFVMNVCGDDIP